MKTNEKKLVLQISKNPENTLKKLSEDEIANVIQLANYHYYHSSSPLFSDNVFDIIKEHLEEKNPHHPILKNIGAVIADDDERKSKLPYFMASMDKIKSDGAVIDKWKKKYSGRVVISDKLDGNSGMIYYKNGEAKLYTRGDGEVGQNISHLLPFIQNIPDFNKFSKYPEFTTRGELIISKKSFEKIKHLGANARNLLAGLLNSKIPNLEVAKHAQFIAYELIKPHYEPSKQFELMTKMGFKVSHNTILNIEDINAVMLSSLLMERRSDSEFEIDGIICCHDAIHNRKDGENPKHAFAFKSVAMMDRAEIIVLGVEWTASKDYILKPVVIFKGVNLSGVVVRRATGFNGSFIMKNKIGPGAKLLIMRSGDVIPHIMEIVEPATPAMPDIAYEWTESGVDIMVANKDNAKDDVALKNLGHFFTKVKVTGLSEGTLAKLQKAGIDTVGKIINVSKADLLLVDGFKEKMAEKIFLAIQDRFKEVDPVLLASASNTWGRGISEKKLQSVLNKVPELLTNKNYKLSVSELVTIDSIEKKTAELLIKNQPHFWKFVEDNKLQKYFKNKLEIKEEDKLDKQIFQGVSFLFTGVRSKPTEDFIKSRGGEMKSSISKKLNILICKDPTSTSSKMKEAREIGVEIVSLTDFAKKHNINL